MNRLHIHSIGKRWRKPQLHRTGKPAGWTALLLLLLLPAACIQDEPAPAVGEGEYMVRLLIDPQTATTRAPGDETGVSGIHQLRVYVFKGQTRVGYYENMYLQATGQAYYVPFRLTEGGNLDFYVVANEGGVSIDNDHNILTENTSKETLELAGFLVENIGRNPGDLLTGKTQAQVPGTDIPEGQVQQVTCALSRPYSLLNIFFAKSTATCTATVTGVKLHNYSRYGYFSDRDIATDYTTDRNNNHTEEFTFPSATGEAITVSTVVPEDEQKTGNYGNESFTKPVALDRDGSSKWTTDWENIEQVDSPYLEIAYTLNGAKKTANVYLPPIAKTNCKYNVKCLIIEKGGLAVRCEVQDWKDQKHDYVISDGGQFTLINTNMREVTQSTKVYATQYSESAGASDRQFTLTLNMTSPEGVRWTAHLTNALDFEFVEDDSYQSTGVGGSTKGIAIRVRPTKEYDAGIVRETELYITIGTAQSTKQQFDSDMSYSEDGTSICIRQVSASEGDAIWNTANGNNEEPQP